MSTLFLFIFLVFLTVCQALHHGTADNDTTILTKLTLEDIIFSSPDLDKRASLSFGKKNMIKVPLLKAEHASYPHYHMWFIKVPIIGSRLANPRHRSHQGIYSFQIDTYGAFSAVRFDVNYFDARRPDRKEGYWRPERLFSGVPGTGGPADRSQITIASGVTWKGRLLHLRRARLLYGFFGLSLPDSRVEKEMDSLTNLLKMFKSQVFTLSLSEQGSEFRIGGFDESPEVVEFYKVVKSSGPHQPWQIGQVRIFVDAREIEPERTEHTEHTEYIYGIPKFTTVFDSSIPYIYGPPGEVSVMREAINDARLQGRDPVVYFQWENRTKWPVKSHMDVWYRLFLPGNQGMEGWVLGTEFMYPYEIVFEVNRDGVPQVGIRRGPGYYQTLPALPPSRPLTSPPRPLGSSEELSDPVPPYNKR